MGAYENPRIIPTPDYGQIFRNNFIAGQQMVESAFARKKAAEEKERLKQERIADKELAFALQVGEIKAGDMTNALQQLGYNEANVYAENLRKYENNEISWQDFSQNRINSFKKLGELKEVGIILKKQTDELKDFDKSSFQENPELWGLQEAWEQQKIIPEYIDGELFLTYPGADGKNHTISVENLKDGTFFNYNEKRNLKAANYTALTVDAQIEKRAFQKTTYDASGNLVGAKVEEYTATREEYVDNMVNGNKMSELFDSASTNGSIWLDDVVQTVDENTLRSMLSEVAKNNNLSEEEQKQFLNIALNKQEDGTIVSNYSDINIGKNSYRGLIDQVSKKVVAERAFDDHLDKEDKLAPPVEIFREKEPEAPEGDSSTAASDYVTTTYGNTLSLDKRRKLTAFLEDWNNQGWQGKNVRGIFESIKSQDASVFGERAGGVVNQQYMTIAQLNHEYCKSKFADEETHCVMPDGTRPYDAKVPPILMQRSNNPHGRKEIEKIGKWLADNRGKNTILKFANVGDEANPVYTAFGKDGNLQFDKIDGDSKSAADIIQIIQELPAYFGVEPNILNKEITRLLNQK